MTRNIPLPTVPAIGRAPTEEEIAFVRDRRVGRLATADKQGNPYAVPVCYAVLETPDGPVIVSALDQKPKSRPLERLRRVQNILTRPEAALIVDDYAEDWDRLAFVQLRGGARLIDPGQPGHQEAVGALRVKYPQYARMAIDAAPVIWIETLSASSWRSDREDRSLPRPSDLPSIVRGRRSVRAFRAEPVERDVVERAIAAAGWAPSPHGRQPWRFAVVESFERRRALADAMADTWRRQLELDGQEPEIVQIRLDKSRERILTASVLVVVCLYLADLDVYPDADRQAAETTMAIQSLGAAVQNLLLSIYADGLDAGWMCAPLFCPDVVRDTLGLDDALLPHALLPVGHAAKDPVRRERRPLDDLIVSWE
ncbi:MAG: TIGR03668 family PPOX class F420-dependent oxidoreductase [Thermomicrobiales bacterium]